MIHICLVSMLNIQLFCHFINRKLADRFEMRHGENGSGKRTLTVREEERRQKKRKGGLPIRGSFN